MNIWKNLPLHVMIAMLITVLLIAAACGGGNVAVDPANAPDQVGVTTVEGLTLANPASLSRAVSYVPSERAWQGSAFNALMPQQRAAVVGSAVALTPSWDPLAPTVGGLAYATFEFILPAYSEATEISVGWGAEVPDSSDVFLGLSHWGNNAWDWDQPADTGSLSLSSLAPYFDADGRILVVVLITGSNPGTLNWVRIGQNVPPVTAFSGGPLTGNIPLSVEFSTMDCLDIDGDITLVQYDLDGDNAWEINDTALGEKSFIYTSAGTYDARVRLQDDNGGITTDLLTVVANDPSNIPPTAVLNANPTSGEPGLEVSFSAIGSIDPDGG